MTWFAIFAIYFVLWWLVLFMVIPFSVRTQDEARDVTLGTEASAPPHGPSHMLKVVLRTTLVTTVLFAVFYYVRTRTGFSLENYLPHIPTKF